MAQKPQPAARPVEGSARATADSCGGGGVKRSPWHHSAPASPGTKPLCTAGQSLTSKAQFWDSPEAGEAAMQQKPPGSSPNSGIHCVDRGWAAPKDLSLLARAHLPKLALGQVWVTGSERRDND